MVRESTKWPPWHKFKLSSPMNQSGDGTIFVKRDTWKCDCNRSQNSKNLIVIGWQNCWTRVHNTWLPPSQYVAWHRFFKTALVLGRLLRATSTSMTLLMFVCRFFKNTASGGFSTYSTYFTRSTYYTYSTRLHRETAAHCSVLTEILHILNILSCSLFSCPSTWTCSLLRAIWP